MKLRNDNDGYGLVTKTLHWLTVLAITAQFIIGYLLDDESGHGRGAAEDAGKIPVTAGAVGVTTTGPLVSGTATTSSSRCTSRLD